MNNTGKLQEAIFVKAINNKSVGEVSPGFKKNLALMFKDFDDNDVIEAGLLRGSQKPDFYISINGDIRNVSLKVGMATEVGSYGLKPFIAYLRSKGISERTLKTIVNLHFCDGTLNNTGKIKYELNEYKSEYEEDIKAANIELNKDESLIKDIVYRIVFKGFYDENIVADYIYFGTEEYGVCCNYRQMDKAISAKRWAHIRNLHIGPIQFRPVARYAHRKVKDDSKRWGMRFFWSGLANEVERISRQFPYQHDGYIPLNERVALSNRS